MVTTPKKSEEQTWTWSGAGFTRQTPSEKQTAAPESSLLYKRARYYHPGLGQFINRDPLGYVDGMSQYRGYFVPGAVDPFGLDENDGLDGPFEASVFYQVLFLKAVEDWTGISTGHEEGRDLYLKNNHHDVFKANPHLRNLPSIVVAQNPNGPPNASTAESIDNVLNTIALVGSMVAGGPRGGGGGGVVGRGGGVVAGRGRGVLAGRGRGVLVRRTVKVKQTQPPYACRAFPSPDKHVSETAQKLEVMFGRERVISVNTQVPANVRGGTREIDIVMDEFYIQVKRDKSKKLFKQMNNTIGTIEDTSKQVIGYAPDNYSNRAWTNAAEKGLPIARNFEELVAMLKELSN